MSGSPGAGPGDPGLLTLDALAGLAQADVVVHDALVDRRVLALAGAQARLEFAGKRGGRPSTHQDDISNRLVELARAGHRVLRLKGGDPCVFGRGGEEALALAAAGVPYRIIPGVTAGLAGLTAAGIPATFRGINRAVILAAGYGADDDGVRLGGAGAHRPADRAVHGDAQPCDDRRRADARRLAAGHARQRSSSPRPRPTSASSSPRSRAVAADAQQHQLGTPSIIVVGNIVKVRQDLLDALAMAESEGAR